MRKSQESKLLISERFTLEDLTHSDIAIRKGIDNTPDADTVENLKVLAGTLEQIEKLLGHRITRHSGFRSRKLNSAVGGSPTSGHLFGYCEDFTCPEFGTPKEICIEIAASNITFDQLIYEGSWVHISVDPRYRLQILTANFSNGKATYTHGISA